MQNLSVLPGPVSQPRLPRGPQMLKRLLGASPECELHGANSPQRGQLESYIAGCFARAYQAEVSEFAPLLLGLRCAGSISGVAGIRPAETGKLFLEHYLDAPVEQAVAAVFGKPVSRHEVVEVSNFAALRPGACQLLLLMLAGILPTVGFRYAAFVGTPQIERIVGKFHAAIKPLAAAQLSRLGLAADHWGSYYDSQPQVMVIDLQVTAALLRSKRLPAAVFEYYKTEICALSESLRTFRQCRFDSPAVVSEP
jgi:hypothetical protein